ncbi:DUF3592 domain-containing protein [Streptomyces yangpuensis]|uniref:DUF3592 domain-containing protein n=1 Tax=Streptomyces yangpuensis TaxID=1648182 RepID=A0ABY5PZH3_9ACTN|nr:DUF3592 domain-containing protein [Streptomyces yangpuensis]UUY49374.1 DUF3592 domain-containing protein [Streptomyces yangpuensis]
MLALGATYGPGSVLLGLLVAAVGVVGLVSMVRAALVNRRTMREGALAEARCLEAYVVHNRSSDGYTTSQRRLILGFRTPEGREVRTEMVAHVPYAVGDIVPVRYLPECPERVVPAGASFGIDLASGLKGVVLVGVIYAGLSLTVLALGASGG